METDSGSESTDFIEVGTEESSTEGSSSGYDTDSDSDTSILNLMIQNVVQNIASYRQCREANRHFQFNVQEASFVDNFRKEQEIITDLRKLISNISTWKDVTTAEMKGFFFCYFQWASDKKK